MLRFQKFLYICIVRKMVLSMKTRAEIIELLKKFKQTSALKYGICSLGIFGSFARGQQDENSDLDILVKLQRADFFTIEKIREELEQLTNIEKIDIINYKESLRDSFKQNILKDAVYI